MSTHTNKAIVIDTPVLLDRDLTKLSGSCCQVCGDNLNSSNYVTYRLSLEYKWCLAQAICSECLECYIDSQNEKVKHFVTEFSSLSGCSKMLKHLLKGEYGVPVNLQDTVIFPSIDNETVANYIDPIFGRKNEVYQLSIGSSGVNRDPRLSNAPSDIASVRQVLSDIVESVSKKLQDYNATDYQLENDDDVEEIKTSLAKLRELL